MKNKPIYHHVHFREACWGFRSENNIVVWAASLGNWMIGKKLEEVKRILKKKGGKIYQEYSE